MNGMGAFNGMQQMRRDRGLEIMGVDNDTRKVNV